MYGLRNVGKHLEGMTKKPWQAWTLFHRRAKVPKADLVPRLQKSAYDLAYQIAAFASACQWALIKHREGILNRQLLQARLGDVATELFMASCVYARLLSQEAPPTKREMQTGLYYMHLAHQRNQDRLRALKENNDPATISTANIWLQDLA